MSTPVSIRYEQAVYGSFPFWDRGYAVLARSAGCRDEWIRDLLTVCRGHGERPAGAAGPGGLMAVRLPSGPWAIIGPSPQGADDRGRPGATAFHALFVSGADYRAIGADPFALAGRLVREWTAGATLDAGTLDVEPGPMPDPVPGDDRAGRIAAALARGRRVAIEADRPIDDLARAVWRALPARRRSRLSLATWAYANGNRHDLVALPRQAGVAVHPSYVDPDAGPRPARSLPRPGPTAAGWVAWVGFGLVVLAALVRPGADPGEPVAPTVVPVVSAAVPETGPPGPSGRPVDPAERARIAEAVSDLVARFEVPGPPGGDPLAALRRHLTYPGPVLTAAERARLAAPGDLDHDRPLAWDALIARFAPDRPLPPGFADGPPDWRLRTLAWSFHLDPGSRPAAEIPRFLADELARPWPVASPPLAARYPALADYARFLRRLPSR